MGVFHDASSDVYLVANLGDTADRGGFISRISRRGEMSDLAWIDGRGPGAVLRAPTGFALGGDTLFVVDVDSVRLFHRVSGASLGALPVEGATALRDAALGKHSQIFVTDSALTEVDGTLESRGIGAIFQIGANGRAKTFLKRRYLASPTGIATAGAGLAVVSYDKGKVYLFGASRERTELAQLPQAQAEGLAALANGQYLVSSAAAGTVYRITKEGEVRIEIDGLAAPAGIAVDARRRRILVAIPSLNRVEIHALGADSG